MYRNGHFFLLLSPSSSSSSSSSSKIYMFFLFDQVESSSFNKFSTLTPSLDGEMIFLNQFFLKIKISLKDGFCVFKGCVSLRYVYTSSHPRSCRRIRETYGARW